MTIVSAKVAPEWSGRETFGTGRNRSVPYIVVSDDIDDGPGNIVAHFNASGTLPGLGTTYNHGNDIDASLFLQGMNPTRDPASDPTNTDDGKPRIAWRVDCEYTELGDSEVGEDENGDIQNDPLQWRDRIEVGFIDRVVDAWDGYFLGVATGIDAVPRAAMGAGDANAPQLAIDATKRVPVIASNGQPFDPPAQRAKSDMVLRYTTNRQSYPGTWPAYRDEVNDKALEFDSLFYGVSFSFPLYTLKCADIGGTFRLVNGVRYWEMTLEYHYRKDKWSELILDQGTMVAAHDGMLDGEGGTITIPSANERAIPTVLRIREPEGTTKTERHPAPGPVLLDGNGGVLLGAVNRQNARWLEYLFYDPGALEVLPGLSTP